MGGRASFDFYTSNIPEKVIRNMHVWHHGRAAVHMRHIDGLTMENLVALGPSNKPRGIGIDFQKRFVRNLKIRNADIQNMREGILVPNITDFLLGQGGGAAGPMIIENSYLRNETNIKMNTLWIDPVGPPAASHDNLVNFPTRAVEVRNTTFVPLGSGGRNVEMIAILAVKSDRLNVIKRDELRIYDYNGFPGDNFQVYYLEQAPNVVVPKTQIDLLIGSPVSGLTNQQNWNQHGVAIAGAVAPCVDNTSHPDITGFVCPLGGGSPPDTTPPSAPTGLGVF